MAGEREEAARRVVAAAHRPPEGDRRLHRRQGRVRIPLRQALRRQEKGPRRRAVHRREPLPAPRAGRRRERRADRRRLRIKERRRAGLRPDDPGKPQDRRRAAGAQGGQDRVLLDHALAGRSGLRRGPIYRGRQRLRPRNARPSSSARSSAPSPAPTWWPPPARPATPASTS